MKYFSTFTFCCFTIISSAQSLNKDYWTPVIEKEEGRGCYVQAYTDASISSETKEFNVYLGNLTQNLDYLKEINTFDLARFKSGKGGGAGFGKNCLSQDPNDCLKIWSQNWNRQYQQKVFVVTDATKTDKFKKRQLIELSVTDQRAILSEVQVLCGNKITEDIHKQIRAKLVSAGLLSGRMKTQIAQNYKTALLAYQKLHKLPIGWLDYKTLEHMGVDF